MRQALFVTLALVVSCYKPPAAPAQGWANKLFPQGTVHDFGTVPRGAQLLHRFAITNIYAVPLEFTQVRVSCGCSTATPSKKVLQPRESCTLDVSMDGRRFTGIKNITVYVTVGPTYVSTAELRVSANSRSDVVFNPGAVVFGTVAPGQTPTQPVDVEYAGNLDWRVTEVLARDTPFTVELGELYRRQPRPGTHQVGYRVKVTLKTDAPAGALKREIHLRTNDPASPLISVLVEANVEASLSVLPSPLRLGTMQLGRMVQQRVVVRGKAPFRVLAVDGLGEGLELAAPPSTTPALVQMLTFRCQPGRAGDYRRSVRIRTDLQNTPLPLSIEGSAAP